MVVSPVDVSHQTSPLTEGIEFVLDGSRIQPVFVGIFLSCSVSMCDLILHARVVWWQWYSLVHITILCWFAHCQTGVVNCKSLSEPSRFIGHCDELSGSAPCCVLNCCLPGGRTKTFGKERSTEIWRYCPAICQKWTWNHQPFTNVGFAVSTTTMNHCHVCVENHHCWSSEPLLVINH